MIYGGILLVIGIIVAIVTAAQKRGDRATHTSEASDAATSPVRLGVLARSRPDLQAAVAANPAAPQELLQWLAASGTPEAAATARARLGV